MEIVINIQYGGFGLSHNAIMEEYAKLKGINLYAYVDSSNDKIREYDGTNGGNDDSFVFYYTKKIDKIEDSAASFFSVNNIKRDDPALIETVRILGTKANTPYSYLKIVEIPDDVNWRIIEREGGKEIIEEVHRIWS